jgi:hypothetical protein
MNADKVQAQENEKGRLLFGTRSPSQKLFAIRSIRFIRGSYQVLFSSPIGIQGVSIRSLGRGFRPLSGLAFSASTL